MNNQWIDVNDRLPENDILVMVCWHDEYCQYDFDYIDEEVWGLWFNRAEHFNIAGGNCSEDAPYTHWQPLPPPPLTTKGEECESKTSISGKQN